MSFFSFGPLCVWFLCRKAFFLSFGLATPFGIVLEVTCSRNLPLILLSGLHTSSAFSYTPCAFHCTTHHFVMQLTILVCRLWEAISFWFIFVSSVLSTKLVSSKSQDLIAHVKAPGEFFFGIADSFSLPWTLKETVIHFQHSKESTRNCSFTKLHIQRETPGSFASA